MDNKLVALYTILLLSLVVLLTSVNTISISPRYPAGQPVNNNKNNEEEDDGGGGGGGEDPHHESDNWEQQELINLRKKILKSLGLTRLPDISKVNISPEEMEAAMKTYYKNVEETERRNRQETESSIQEQSIVYTYNDQSVNPPPGVVPYSGNLTSSWLYFPTNSLANLSSSVRTSASIVATLRLHRSMNMDLASSAAFHLYHVTAYDELELVASQPASALTQDDSGYLWDITDLATGWIEMPTLNGGLLLTCTHCDKLASLIELTLTRPQLLVRVTRNVHIRTKRSKQNTISDFTPTEGMLNCDSRKERRCCRKSLNVSIADLGLEKYILMPSYFNAYYCQGKCPHNHNPASTHANIQSFLSMKKSEKRHKKIPKLCCAPSKLKSLHIVHLNESGQPTQSTWENVIVERCACS